MEVFMLRRSSRSKFLPDRYVFPGGGLETHDSEPSAIARLYKMPERLIDKSSYFRDLPHEGAYEDVESLTAEQESGLFVATFRELFEEAGVLLAVEEGSLQPYHVQETEARLQEFATFRKALHAGEITFTQILEQNKLLLDVSRLTYYSHWITPSVEPIRYDTRFFLAVARPDQIAESDYKETTDGLWINPQEALDRYQAKTFNLIYPTILHLLRLAAQPTIEALLIAAQTKTIIPVSPLVEQIDGSLNFQLADDVAERW